ncbi:phage tail protein [Corynebacterium tapiri]|uniref:Tape measure protein n=1 Tax=Corynebacterium tapiri TaxID=1448266 RepID=A0A5C4U5L9_9CORY|nr:tape measure protein [Corynebacterium tapiri]TNL98771.1 tape measure protein [Corynebacterium tapiri]
MAATGVELANAWVTIKPSTKDIAPEVTKALKGIDTTSVGSKLGDRLNGALSKSLKIGAAATGAAVGGVLAGAITKGMSRLTAIEGAQAKLKGLGNSASDVASIMDNALASVKGTANGLGEAAAVSASMVAAGIKPGQQLEQTLKTVGDTAAIAGRSMQDVGLIFGSIAARGKLQGDDMLQLMSSGIPVLQLLAEETGKTSEEISDMVSKGEIDFATFERAMRNGMGGAALEMGNTFSGALKNMGAAMGRFGEALAGPAFKAAPPLFAAIGGAFDAMAAGFKPASERITAMLVPAMERLGGSVNNMGPVFEAVGRWVGELAEKITRVAVDPSTWETIKVVFVGIGEAAKAIGSPLLSLVGVFGRIAGAISVQVWDALIRVLEALAPVLEHVVVPALEKIASMAEKHPELVGALVTAWMGMMVLNKITAPLRGVAGALLAVGHVFIMMKFADEMTKLAGAVAKTNPALSSFARMAANLTKAFNPLGTVLRFIMSPIKALAGLFVQLITKLNPITAIISIVVTALVLFFTKTEMGRELWQRFVDALSAGWQWISAKAMEAWAQIQPVLQALWDKITELATQVMPVLISAGQKLWQAISPVVKFIVDALTQIGQIAVNILGGVLAVALGLLIVAWNGLAAAFNWAWTNVLQPILNGLGEVFTWLWTTIISPTIDWIKAKWIDLSAVFTAVWDFLKANVFDLMGAAFTWLWTEVISPVIDWIKGKWTELSNAFTIVWTVIKTTVLDAFGAAFNWLWSNVISPVVDWIKGKWSDLSALMGAVWNWISANVFAPMGAGFNALWANVVRPVVDWVAGKWDWLKGALAAAWQWIDSNVLGAFRNGMNNLKAFFGTVVDGISSAWSTLRGALAKPVNFLINTVYNDGIAKAWDTIGSFLPLNPKTARRLSPIGGYATGGAIRGKGTGTSDDIPAWLSNGEHVLTAADVKAFGGQGAVYAIRNALQDGQGFTFDGRKLAILPEHLKNRTGDLLGAAPSLFPAFADGGEVRPMWELQLERGHQWAKSRHGRPYVLGGSADGGGGTDCSGFMSGIADVMGGGTGHRQWATMAFNGGGNSQYPTGPQGFVAGLKGNTFSIGVTNGGAAGGHTAGTLGATSRVGAVNVESGGSPSMVKYGTGAAGANDGYFTTHYHLPIGPGGAFVIGKGTGGPSPDQMRKFITDKVSGAIDKIMGPIKGRLPSGPPEYNNIPRGAYDKGKTALSEGVGKVVQGLGDKLSTVYTAAQEVGELVRNAGRGVMALAGRAIGLHDSGGWLQSGNLALNLSGKPEPVLTNSQWSLVAQGIRKIGELIPALEKQADAIAKSLEKGDGGNIGAWLSGSTIKEKLDMATKLPMVGSLFSPFTGVAGGVDSLTKAYDDQAKAAGDVVAAEDALNTARAEGDANKIADAEKKYAAAKAVATKAAVAAGQAEIALAIEVADLVMGLVDRLIGSIMTARVEAFKGMASMAGSVRELVGMAEKFRNEITGLVVSFATSAIDLAAAERNVRIVRMDGAKASLEAAKTVAEAQAKFDAQRKADMRRAALDYTDLSLAYDRFRWNMRQAGHDAMNELAAWSDESHALYSELLAAQVGQQLAIKKAQESNLEATLKATLAALDLRDVTSSLGVATQKLAVMSGSAFGYDSVQATVGQRYANLVAEKAGLQADQANIKTWINPVNWFTAMPAAQRRIKQIDAELANLAKRDDFKDFDRSTKAAIDKAAVSAGFMGFFGAGDKVAGMIKNSALGDPARALDQIKFEHSVIDLKAEQDKLRSKIDRDLAELDSRAKTDPLKTEIMGLEREKAANETWAEYWRADNAEVKKALADLAKVQADNATTLKGMAAESKTINLYGNTASMDDVEKMLGDLGYRVNRLENPRPSALDVVGARR